MNNKLLELGILIFFIIALIFIACIWHIGWTREDILYEEYETLKNIPKNIQKLFKKIIMKE